MKVRQEEALLPKKTVDVDGYREGEGVSKEVEEEETTSKTNKCHVNRSVTWMDQAKRYTFLKYIDSTSSICAIGIVLLHVAVGVGFFMLYPGEQWTFVDSLYFCIVTLTTVGYGDTEPSTTGGKIFVSLYVLFGLGIVFSFLDSIMQGLWDSHENFVVSMFEDDETKEEEEKDHGENSTLEEPSLNIFYVSVVGLICIAIVGLVVGMWLEDWKFEDAVYFVSVSATTVGYGDIHPSRDAMKLFAVVWLVFLTLGLGNCISEYQTYQLEKLKYKSRRDVLEKRWTRNDLISYDKDRDGVVNELEYIVQTLIKMELVNESDIKAIVRQFRERDRDASGAISTADIGLVGTS